MERGVKQGPVVSPALFLLVMDPFLRQLQKSGLGHSVNEFYVGGFLHANDIRTVATSAESLEAQVGIVRKFALENYLKLNVQKCETVLFSHTSSGSVAPQCEVDGTVIPTCGEGSVCASGGKVT